MKKSKIIIVAIIGLLILGMGIAIEVMDTDRIITADRLPQPVKTVLDNNYPGTPIAFAKEKKELFNTVYEVQLANGLELELNKEGVVTDIDD